MIERLPTRYAWTPNEPVPPEYRPTRKLVFEPRIVLGIPAVMLWVEEQRGQEITTVEGSCYLVTAPSYDVPKTVGGSEREWAAALLCAIIRNEPSAYKHLVQFMPVLEVAMEKP